MNAIRFRRFRLWSATVVLTTAILACNISSTPAPGSTPSNTPASPLASTPSDTPTVTSEGNAAPTETPTNTETATSTPIVHVMVPAEPPGAFLSQITDQNSSALASAHRANGGENFSTNLFERPFSSTSMDYSADLDIISTQLTRDATWVYVTTNLAGQNPSGGLTGEYGVELDLNLDGRGEVLVMAAKPGGAWSTDGVRVWTDGNKDVGGTHPIQSDAPAETNGYDTLVFDQGSGSDPDAAWARVSPANPNSVQIAFKSVLINDSGKYLWEAWTINDSMLDPAWFDYNDHFTLAQAGSPLIEDATNYPLKALALVDNTCRWSVGFTPTGSEPGGVCPVPATPTPKPTATRTPTVTPIVPGSISGVVYNNGVNGGLNYDPAISKPASGISVSVNSGDCASPGALIATDVTGAKGGFFFSLNAGTYCVSASTPSSHQTGPKTVKVTNGGAVNNVDFFYYQFLG